jgi:hypothetical protein
MLFVISRSSPSNLAMDRLMFIQTVSNQKYLKRFVIGAVRVELSERWLWHSGVLSSTGNDKGAVVWQVGLLILRA